MGRKTFESIGRVLPGRTNIIITRDLNYKVERATIVSSIDQAIEKAKSATGADEVFFIGGANIFGQIIKTADKLYLTKINSEAPLADVFFPDYSDFTKTVFSEKHNEEGLEYEFLDLERD
jgi:dihydrofolate reductase